MAKKPTHYVRNKDLLAEVIKSKANLAENPEDLGGAMTPELVEMYMLMVERYATKWHWSQYSYMDEAKQQAIVTFCAKWHKFDPDKSDNPFSYYTTMISNSFKGVIGSETKLGKIRDKIREDNGMLPSHRRQMEDESFQKMAMDEEDRKRREEAMPSDEDE